MIHNQWEPKTHESGVIVQAKTHGCGVIVQLLSIVEFQ